MNKKTVSQSKVSEASGKQGDQHLKTIASKASSMRRTLAPARVNPVLLHPRERRMKLDGEWHFRLDPDERGLKECWFENHDILTDPIQVPGCWQGQGFGSDEKVQLFEKRGAARVFRATYTGTGWYGKQFQVPATWKGLRVWLNFGGAHPSAEVWLNGVRLGENNLPFVPFGFEITDRIRADKENTVIVRVHEHARALGLQYNLQGNWSGLYRDVELTATGGNFIEEFRAYPNLDRQDVRLWVRVGGAIASSQSLALRISVKAIDATTREAIATIPIVSGITECSLWAPSPIPWSPEHPQLYRVDAVLADGDLPLDALSERVGFVRLETDGKHFLINGRPCFVRGHGDFPICPETGSPDTDRARWRKKLKTLRAYGYNQVRCNSFVYNPEYFDVADEMGLLVQSEMGVLRSYIGAHPTRDNREVPNTHGQGDPIIARNIAEPFYYREALRRQWNLVVARDVNHPSANIYCMSNELTVARGLISDETVADYQDMAWRCYGETKAIKPGAMVLWTDGGSCATEEALPADFVNDEAEKDAKCRKPLIQHEFRWWSSYPDVRIAQKFSGAVRPYAQEWAQEVAERKGVAHLLPQFAVNSQRLQFLEAKTKMEMRRRDFPRLAGVSHYSASDITISPQGIVDDFYDQKYADRDTWLQTNGDTVILSSLNFNDRVLQAGNVFKCRFFVSDFAHPSMTAPTIAWRLVAGDEILASGKIAYAHQPCCTCPAGEVEMTVPSVAKARAARLEAVLREGDRRVVNSWNLWLFPAGDSLPVTVRCYGSPDSTWLVNWTGIPKVSRENLATGEVVLTEELDDRLVKFMREGGRVILAARMGLVRTHGPVIGQMSYFFTPGANYPPYEDGQNGTIILNHPAFGDFPHEGFADLQFYRLMEAAPPIDLERLDLDQGDPIIRVIHRYPVCAPVAYLLERSVGKGGMLICALSLDPAWAEARHLLGQLCGYVAGKTFHPATEESDSVLTRLQKAIASPDSRTRIPYMDPLTHAGFRNAVVVHKHDTGWRFQTDPVDEGFAAGWMQTDLDDKSWPLIDANLRWQDQGYGGYYGTAWYRRVFDPPAVEAGKRLVLCFGAVDGNACLFVNGREVGEHNLAPNGTGWDQPFFFDVTDFIVIEKPNIMAVRVRKLVCSSGITGGVSLVSADKVRRIE